jgi:hypothetical protein
VLTIAAPGILQGDTDADGDSLNVFSVNVTGLQGTLEAQTNGSFSFTSNAGFSGPTSFTYTVGDGFGGFDTGLVTINVVNAAPVADDESYTMVAGQTLTVAAPGVLDGDTDADGDTLSVASVNVTGLQGVLTPQTNGAFTFTPNAGFVGQTGFSYTVNDGFGGFDTGAVTINVQGAQKIIHLGDAVGRPTLSNPNVWQPFWTDSDVSISHKADYTNTGENWTAAKFNALGTTLLSGGDLWNGDLGVSGRNAATSSIQQEIQGKEALRFDLDGAANKVKINLSQFFADDDANTTNFNESGRLQAFDSNGLLVKETVFTADNANGTKLVTLESNAAFSSIVLTTGNYDANNNFVFGAYSNDSGQLAAAPTAHGSDFLVHNIEIELITLVGVGGA